MSNFDVPDHPVIRNLMQTGYPDGKEPDWPRCPVCGQECETFYYSKQHHEVMGCEICLLEQSSWEYWEGEHRDSEYGDVAKW